jgi:hypothetical protein
MEVILEEQIVGHFSLLESDMTVDIPILGTINRMIQTLPK